MPEDTTLGVGVAVAVGMGVTVAVGVGVMVAVGVGVTVTVGVGVGVTVEPATVRAYSADAAEPVLFINFTTYLWEPLAIPVKVTVPA